MKSKEVTHTQKLKVTEMPGFFLIEGKKDEAWGIRSKDYKKLCKRYKGTDWLFEPLPRKIGRLTGVSEEYLQHYRDFPNLNTDWDTVSEDIRSLCKAGKFDQVVQNYVPYDGFLYEIAGTPLYRSFWMELNERGWDGLEKRDLYDILAMIKQDDRVQRATIEDVPYYNRDLQGEHSLKYYFYPKDQKEFLELYNANYHQRNCLIEKWIGIGD